MSAQRAHDIQQPRQPVRRRKEKPAILFVDDEQRVLNSMRALFRRDYDVHVTTRGVEALQILGQKTIDVIVADQRMPEMTGVEVLGAGKEVSPNTVRILLTGYADLDAIEGSINVGEVFRFLSKPCPPNHLRETIKLAVDIAKKARMPVAPAPARAAAEKPAAKPKAKAAPVKLAPVPPADPDPSMEIAFDQTIANDLAEQVEREGEEIILGSDAEPELDLGDTIAQEDLTEAPAEDAKPVPDPNVEGFKLELEATGARPTVAPTPDPVSSTVTNDSSAADNATEIVLGGDEQGGANCDAYGSVHGKVGVVIFSSGDSFAESATAMLSPAHDVAHAKTLVQVTEILAKGEAGVLVTDFVSEGRVLRKMIATLKRYLPELITIVIS
ncbi:MAG: response regulator, partial [Pseudomonadota bacterium]